MTGLMVVIVILLVAILLWMVAITCLYYALVRNVKTLRGASADAVGQQSEITRRILGLFESLYDLTTTLDVEVEEYKNKVQKMVDETENDKAFALKTIQEARRLQSAISAKLGEGDTVEQTIGNPSEV